MIVPKKGFKLGTKVADGSDPRYLCDKDCTGCVINDARQKSIKGGEVVK